MARRIEVELTSSRDDGTWTWRAAGARQPKGELDGALLYQDAKVGDVVKVEAEFHLDGIEVTTVFPPKEAKVRTDVLPMVSRPLRDDELVTTTRARRREGGRGDDRRRGSRRDGGPRGEGEGRREGRREGGGGGEGRPGGDRGERRRWDQPEQEARPKPRRLRPRRTHRDAVVAEVPEEYRPIAQRLLSGGIPEVRKALDEQNAAARAEGGPELAPGPILAIAEDLFPKLRTAEWHDRADAALTDLDELDLRDLRSVVVAADAAARDEETRGLAEQLRQGLNRRVEADHEQWMQDLTAAVNEGRVVRALRLSSRPVKAGAPLPAELAATLAESTSAALAPDISQDRWATVLDAVAFSPVRGAVTPAGVPTEPSPELREAVTKVADRVPHIAALFGIDPAEAARSRSRTRRPRTRKPEGERPSGQRRGGPGAAGGGAPAAPTTTTDRTDEGQPAADPAAGEPAAPQAPTDASALVEEVAEDLGGLPEAPAEAAPAPEAARQHPTAEQSPPAPEPTPASGRAQQEQSAEPGDGTAPESAPAPGPGEQEQSAEPADATAPAPGPGEQERSAEATAPVTGLNADAQPAGESDDGEQPNAG